MKNILTAFEELLNAAIYYVKAAVAVITSNRYLLTATILLALTVGRSFRVGKLFSFTSK